VTSFDITIIGAMDAHLEGECFLRPPLCFPDPSNIASKSGQELFFIL